MRLPWLLALVPGCYFDGSGVGATGQADAGDELAPDADGGPGDAGDPTGIDAMVEVPACPEAYQPADDSTLLHRYRFDDDSSGLTPAVADCADDTPGWTYLVIIDGAAENEWVDKISDARTVWLGMSDETTENTWATQIGGIQSYFSWGALQPDNFFNEDFAVLQDGGAWNDVAAGGGNRYVCECDPPTSFAR